jgi:hypothetical protein
MPPMPTEDFGKSFDFLASYEKKFLATVNFGYQGYLHPVKDG